jgi:hypothetical protein
MYTTIVNFILIACSIYFAQSKVFKTDNCESIIPTIIMDCSNQSTSSNSCCFYKKNGKASCKFWGSKFAGTINSSDGLTYQCDNPKGSVCGVYNPFSIKDCTNFSASTNACCYFNQGGRKGCLWLGSGYKGNSIINGLNVSCNSKYIGLYPFIVLVILITLF